MEEDDRAGLLAAAGLSLSLNHCHGASIGGGGSSAARRPLPTPSPTAPSLSLALPSGADGKCSSPPPSASSSSFWKIKREDDGRCDDDGGHRVEKVSPSRVSADEARKKLRLTKEQAAVLENEFKEHTTLSPKQKQALAKQLKLRPRQVEVWFQNRRARTKLNRTEVELQILRRCCETLTEENSRLQKELNELKHSPAHHKQSAPGQRYLKLLPQAPPHRLCPSCTKVMGGEEGGATGGGAGRVAAAPGSKTNFFNPFAHSAAC